MKKLIATTLMSAALAFTFSAQAGEEKTIEGTMSCAKCNLKEANAKACADVVQVEKDGKTTSYYLEEDGKVKTSAHKCTGTQPAKVTGKLEERDGKTYILASKIEVLEGDGAEKKKKKKKEDGAEKKKKKKKDGAAS